MGLPSAGVGGRGAAAGGGGSARLGSWERGGKVEMDLVRVRVLMRERDLARIAIDTIVGACYASIVQELDRKSVV